MRDGFLGACFQARGSFDSRNHRLNAHRRIQQHVVQAARAPLLLIKLADDRSAALVKSGQSLFGVGRLFRECLREPLAFGLRRGIHKNMKTARMACQRAGRSPAYQDAFALLGRILDLLPDQRQHALGIEDLVLAKAIMG